MKLKREAEKERRAELWKKNFLGRRELEKDVGREGGNGKEASGVADEESAGR